MPPLTAILFLTPPSDRHQLIAMDTLLARPWTTETFLAWEDRQEGKHEFDGVRVVPMTGGSVAHQKIVSNLLVLFTRLLWGSAFGALHEMRLRIGQRIRYPDVLVYREPVSQTLRTLTDALVVFDVLSDDTAPTDRVEKLSDYAVVPSLQYYIMLEQASRAAIVCKRAADGAWITHPQTDGAIVLPEFSLALPLDEIYRGLSFPIRENDRSAD